MKLIGKKKEAERLDQMCFGSLPRGLCLVSPHIGAVLCTHTTALPSPPYPHPDTDPYRAHCRMMPQVLLAWLLEPQGKARTA